MESYQIDLIANAYDTKTRPIVVYVDYIKEYLCKYPSAKGAKPSWLFSEILGNQFSKAWGFETSEDCLLYFPKELLREKEVVAMIDKAYFPDPEVPGWGVRFIHNKQVLQPFEKNNDVKELNRIALKELLKLACFDIWLCNEDRNANNPNLIVSLTDDILIPVDHDALFNSDAALTAPDRPLVLLGFEETILSYFFKFKGVRAQARKQFAQNPDLIDIVAETAAKAVSACERKSRLLRQPEEWKLDADLVENRLSAIFAPKWIDRAITTFKDYAHQIANKL